MSLRGFDGLNSYATAQINQKWNGSLNAAIVPSVGRFGGNALRLNDILTGGNITKTWDSQGVWAVGFAINCPGFPAASTPIVQFLDAGNVQVDVRVNADGTLSMTRNGTLLAGGTSTFA